MISKDGIALTLKKNPELCRIRVQVCLINEDILFRVFSTYNYDYHELYFQLWPGIGIILKRVSFKKSTNDNVKIL